MLGGVYPASRSACAQASQSLLTATSIHGVSFVVIVAPPPDSGPSLSSKSPLSIGLAAKLERLAMRR